MNSIAISIGYHVKQAIKQKIIMGEILNLDLFLTRDLVTSQTTSSLVIYRITSLHSPNSPTRLYQLKGGHIRSIFIAVYLVKDTTAHQIHT